MRHPILFEALAPKAGTPPQEWETLFDALRPLARSGVVGISVPEVLDGHYQTVEPRAFAGALQRRLGLRTAVNRITVHHAPGDLAAWVDDTHGRHAICDLVLVGGEKSSQAYPGPGVTEALRLLADRVHGWGGTLGVITIPTRRRVHLDEPERLLAKQAAGADYAVSQILCESQSALRLQGDLASAWRKGDHRPLPLYWSLAPVANRRDVAFLRWLGVQIPAATETTLLEATTPAGRLRLSHDLNLEIARTLLEHAEAAAIGPIGFCIEHVMQGNVPAALELAQHVRELAAGFRRPVAIPS